LCRAISQLNVCRQIAFAEVSRDVFHHILQFYKLQLNEIPRDEIYEHLHNLRKILKQDAFYGNAIVIEKLIDSTLLPQAARLLLRVRDKQVKEKMKSGFNGEQNVHIRCLERLMHEYFN